MRMRHHIIFGAVLLAVSVLPAPKAAAQMYDIISALHREGITIIMVTHEDDIAAYARRHLLMKDGRLVRDDRRPV